MQIILALTELGLLALLASGAGRCALRLSRFPPEKLPSHLWLGCGLAVISYGIFVLSAAHLLHAIGAAVFLIGLAFIGFKEIRLAIGFFMKRLRQLARPEFSLFQIAIACVLIISLSASLVGALAPATFFDSLGYHLAAPQAYLQEGGFVSFPHNLFANFPQFTEMLFSLGLLLHSDILANLLHWIYLPLVLLCLWQWPGKVPAKTRLVACALYAITPAVILLACGTYVDLALTYYSLAAVSIFLRKWPGAKKDILLAGALSGMALSTKYTGGIGLFILAIFCLFQPKKIQNLIRLGAPAGVVFLPWLIKNFVYTGNPVFPFLYDIFPTRISSKELTSHYLFHVSSHGSGISGSLLEKLTSLDFMEALLHFPKLLWNMTWHGTSFGGGFDILGIGFLLLAPFLIYLVKFDKLRTLDSLYAAAALFLWCLTGKVMRFFLVQLPLVSLLYARCLLQGTVKTKWLSRLGGALGIVIVIANLVFLAEAFSIVEPARAVFRMTREEYLTEKLRYYATLRFANEKLSPPVKLLFVGETRSFHSKWPVTASSAFDENPFTDAANRSKNAEDLYQLLKKDGFTHILWSEPERLRLAATYPTLKFTPRGAKTAVSFQRKFLRLLYERNGVLLYEIGKER